MLEIIELHNMQRLFEYIALRSIIITIVWLFSILACLIDFWSGINAAKALGEPLASRGFRRTITKIGDYARVLMFTLMLDIIGSLWTFYKLPFASILCMVAILLIEGKSVIENSRRKKANAGAIPEIIKEILKATTHAEGKNIMDKIEKYILETSKNKTKEGANK